MKNTLKLAVLLFKNSGLTNLGSDSSRTKAKGRWRRALLLLLAGFYLAFVMAAGTAGLYSLLAPAGLADLIPGLYLSLASVLAFFMGVLYVISIFYYAGDIQYLLPLPLPARTIVAAKLLVTLIWLYIFLAVLLLVPLFVYGVVRGSGVFYFVGAGLVFLLLPVLPLCLAAVLVMLVLRFAPLARNKDRFNFLASLLILALALGLVFASQSVGGLARQDLIRLISQGAGQLTRWAVLLFPGLVFADKALSGNWQSLFWQGVFLLLSGLGWSLTLLLASFFYLPAVTAGTTAAGSVRSGPAKLERLTRRSSPAWISYLKKELRILVRTPVFFMNNVLMSFLWPVFFFLPVLAGSRGRQLGAAVKAARQLLFHSESRAGVYVLLAFFALTCIIATTNGIAASSLSREGKAFYLIKILPLSSFGQILIKLLLAVLFGLISILLSLLPALILLKPPVWFSLALLTLLPGALVLPNLTALFFDLYWPKLKWDNEQAAVKQNINLLYALLAAVCWVAFLNSWPLLLKMNFFSATVWLAGSSVFFSLLLGLVLCKILPRRLAALE